MSESVIDKFLVSSGEDSASTLTYIIEITPDAELVGRLSSNEMHLNYEGLFKAAKNESQASTPLCRDRLGSVLSSCSSSSENLSCIDSSDYDDCEY